ncbi:MAG: polysaccharide pyruvyl transferase family protein [Bacteroidaceae bacterium]|nr:polysaccharide pyruvyl transferase family protein [Bacteroidaceae bacterium]
MKKALLTTVFTGYNFGSSLQAYAGKTILESVGYDCQLVALKSIVKGRDIRLKKLITILFRSVMLRKEKGGKSLKTYQSGYRKELIGDSASRFEKFTEEQLKPKYCSWSELKRMAKQCDTCFAGSDQIWNSSTLYVDPLYYLRFASAEKRIAFAPSLGRDFVARYNNKKMAQWISEFAHLSSREDSGVRIIKELTGREATQLIDPTLMVDGETWKKRLDIKYKKDNYILAYFLDKPSEKAKNTIKLLKEALGCKVIGIPYRFNDMTYCDEIVPSGPFEFVELVNNAKCVITDSFHGTAFSINLHTPFYTYGRNYGTAESQNSRVVSILKMMKMEDRFEPVDAVGELSNISFVYSEKVLNEERIKVKDYINSI